MNQDWIAFLQNQPIPRATHRAGLDLSSQDFSGRRLYSLSQFSILRISGRDAGQLLQGQTTCNIKEINESKSVFSAICNPKGRVIATFLLAKQHDDFLMVLPTDLAETVSVHLQKYILRSAVKLEDASHALCLMGLSPADKVLPAFACQQQPGLVAIHFPGIANRIALLANHETMQSLWLEEIERRSAYLASPCEWSYLDHLAGIPWLTQETSGEYIPQMLNIDKLGGISFNKGCYTGQEIVARTHYLGKAKRVMVLADYQSALRPAANALIIEMNGNGEMMGKVLSVVPMDEHTGIMLVVLQSAEAEAKIVCLSDSPTIPIRLKALNYD